MHPTLAPLPDVLLFTLGRCSHQHYLHNSFKRVPVEASTLFQTKDDTPYHVNVGEHGLVVTMQCANPTAEPDARWWGLQGFTLHTALSHPSNFWQGPWPKGLDATHAMADDVTNLFGGDTEVHLNTPFMVSLLVPGLDDQTWALLCTFDMNNKRLSSMSFARTDEWVLASTLPPWF